MKLAMETKVNFFKHHNISMNQCQPQGCVYFEFNFQKPYQSVDFRCPDVHPQQLPAHEMQRLERMFARTAGIVDTLSTAMDLELVDYQVNAAQEVSLDKHGWVKATAIHLSMDIQRLLLNMAWQKSRIPDHDASNNLEMAPNSASGHFTSLKLDHLVKPWYYVDIVDGQRIM
eukprot:scaffold194964_cov20-Tisochrysis_lutea.AAC.1